MMHFRGFLASEASTYRKALKVSERDFFAANNTLFIPWVSFLHLCCKKPNKSSHEKMKNGCWSKNWFVDGTKKCNIEMVLVKIPSCSQ